MKSHFPPPNVSVKYYTEPIYSTEAFYGYEPETLSNDDKVDPSDPDFSDEALDEPIESWGWVNNT